MEIPAVGWLFLQTLDRASVLRKQTPPDNKISSAPVASERFLYSMTSRYNLYSSSVLLWYISGTEFLYHTLKTVKYTWYLIDTFIYMISTFVERRQIEIISLQTYRIITENKECGFRRKNKQIYFLRYIDIFDANRVGWFTIIVVVIPHVRIECFFCTLNNFNCRLG